MTDYAASLKEIQNRKPKINGWNVFVGVFSLFACIGGLTFVWSWLFHFQEPLRIAAWMGIIPSTLTFLVGLSKIGKPV